MNIDSIQGMPICGSRRKMVYMMDIECALSGEQYDIEEERETG